MKITMKAKFILSNINRFEKHVNKKRNRAISHRCLRTDVSRWYTSWSSKVKIFSRIDLFSSFKQRFSCFKEAFSFNKESTSVAERSLEFVCWFEPRKKNCHNKERSSCILVELLEFDCTLTMSWLLLLATWGVREDNDANGGAIGWSSIVVDLLTSFDCASFIFFRFDFDGKLVVLVVDEEDAVRWNDDGFPPWIVCTMLSACSRSPGGSPQPYTCNPS